MEKSEKNCPYWYFMRMRADNIVSLGRHGGFYKGVISHCHQQRVSKGSVGMIISKTGRVITIWDEVFFKLRVYFYGLVSRN